MNSETNRCIGSRVHVTPNVFWRSRVPAVLIGTLVAWNGPSALVQFQGWDGGHDGHGIADNGFVSSAPDCWYIGATSLRLVDEAPVARAPRTGSHEAQVLAHLLSGKTITPGEAILLGYGFRLAVSVQRLREKGHNIITALKRDDHGNPYGEYSLVKRGRDGQRRSEASKRRAA